MVDEHAGRLGVEVPVGADLKGHAFARAAPFRLGKINERALDGQNDFPGHEIAAGKHAQFHVAGAEVNPVG
jgi:hypothetical protein